MIPSINALILCASFLRRAQSKSAMDAVCFERVTQNEAADECSNAAHDFGQVAQFLEEQVKLRKPKKRKAVIHYGAAEPKAK